MGGLGDGQQHVTRLAGERAHRRAVKMKQFLRYQLSWLWASNADLVLYSYWLSLCLSCFLGLKSRAACGIEWRLSSHRE